MCDFECDGCYHRMKRAFLPWVGFAMLTACHHAPPATEVKGSSSIRFVESHAPTPTTPVAEVPAEARLATQALLVASPIEPLAKPVYPPSALGRETMPVAIGVRITVDAPGRVSDTRPSLAVISTPTPRAEEFRAAVEAAVGQWRFRPAELRRFVPMTDPTGAPAWALVGREKTDCTFDVSFIFQATGEVVSRGAK